MHRLRLTAISLVVWASLATVAGAQTIAPPFDSDYSVDLLGSVPGVPTSYGGLTFKLGDPDTILIGGAANNVSGLLYSIGVVRDDGQHVTGFNGTATVYATAAYNDGGVTYGPGGVLFLARWPVNELGQVKAGSHTTDKIISLGPFGIVSSLSALAFVPSGFPGAGRLKLVTYSSGDWYDGVATSDGSGTYDLADVSHRVQIGGGPEGFVYVPPGSPQFTNNTSILVAEYAAGSIATYLIDQDGDPVVASRRLFLGGLSGAEGAVVDPVTGDFLFSTFGGSNQVVAVRGFGSPNACHGSDQNCAAFEDACHSAFCDPRTDLCERAELDDGTPCADASACNTGGHCSAGECIDQSSCPSSETCTDTCDEQAGQCRTCGHPYSNSGCVVNAVFVLQASLDLRDCELCTCDVDSSGTVTATDSLTILRRCAGIAVTFECSDGSALGGPSH